MKQHDFLRIETMESYADLIQSIINIKDYVSYYKNKDKIKQLKEYYATSWLKDYEKEEQHYFPKDLKRGILSQDYLYDLFASLDVFEKEIHSHYLYHCGVIDAFNEVIKAGVKDLALSHPTSKEEIETLLPFTKQICQNYGTYYEVEDKLLITDLFPYSANKGKTVILFYKKEEIIQKYHFLKKRKEEALQNNTYDLIRKEIAQEFGRLLSYSEEAIETYIINNKEKEL